MKTVPGLILAGILAGLAPAGPVALLGGWAARPALGQDNGENRLVYDERTIYASAEFSPALGRYPALDKRLRDTAKKLMDELRDLARIEAGAAGQAGYAFQPYEVIITDELTFENRRFVSVLRMGYAYTGGAHGNDWTEPVLWDRRTRSVVGIEAILKEGRALGEGLRFLSTFLRGGIAREVWDDQIDPTWVGDIEAVTAPDAATLSNFTLLPSTVPGKIGGLAFHYDRYSVAPYVLGGAEIVVPQAVLRPYIRPELLDFFEGEPAPR